MNVSRIDKFLTNATADKPSAVVLGGHSSNGLAFVRSLGRKGIPVLSVGRNRHPAMRSRYGIAYIQPWGDGGEPALLELLLCVGKRLPVSGAILPCADEYVSFLSRHRAALAPYYKFVLPDEVTLARLASKRSQYRLAQEAGIRVPKTVDVAGDLEALSSRIEYPCILKAAHSHLWTDYRAKASLPGTKVLMARSPRELVNYGSVVADSGLEWIVQELIRGDEDQLYALYAYFDRDSQPLAVFVRKKLRGWPVEFGNGCYSVGVWDRELVDLGVHFFQSIGYQGLTNTEFKRDAADGKFKLIEINVRSASQVSLAIDSGVDLPFIAYRDALNMPVQRISTYRRGVRWVRLDADMRSFREYRRRGQLRLRAWLASLKAARSHAYWAWDDPLPALSVASTAVTAKTRNLFGGLRR